MGLLVCIGGCSNTKETVPDRAADHVDAPKSEEAVQEVRKLPAPPGLPGPFLVRLENRFPTQFFGTAATESHIAIAYQSDARDVSLCPESELQICFHGIAAFAERTNPNHPVTVKLYESDTQSGARIDAVAAAGNRFVFALNEGIYVGDTHKTSLVITDHNGHIERAIDFGQPQAHVVQTALSSYQKQQLIVCRSVEPDDGRQQLFPRIVCEFLDVQNSKRSAAATIQVDQPVRSLEVASNGSKSLLAWNEGGKLRVAFLDKPDDAVELGASTALRPLVAVGLDEFAVAWQADDGLMHIDRIPFEGEERRSLVLNGVDNRTLGGLVAVSNGYLSTFTHQNTQQVMLVSPDFESWDLVENSSSPRLFSDYASLDITEAHTGKMIWQTAESLVVPK